MADLLLGTRRYDLTTRPLVMGILNRTRDSFYDRGCHYRLDVLLRRAEQLVRDGADLLDVGARPGGVGVREVPEAEEIELAGETLTALAERFDVPLSVDTQRAAVARVGFAAGAVLGNDMSGFRDAHYLDAAAAAGASVVATHIRLPPGMPDPEPLYHDVVGDVTAGLRELATRAGRVGLGPERVVLDPGLDLGKSWQQSVMLLAAMDTFAGLGHPLLLGASNKIFLGRLLGSARTSADRPRWRRPRSACYAAAGCCGCTTSGAPARPATWPRPCCAPTPGRKSPPPHSMRRTRCASTAESLRVTQRSDPATERGDHGRVFVGTKTTRTPAHDHRVLAQKCPQGDAAQFSVPSASAASVSIR